MAELNNNQIEILRLGLQWAFVSFDRLDLFLREKLGRRLNSYAGEVGPFPVAVFKLIEGAEAEGWIKDLVSKAYQARPKNKNIADIAAALGIKIYLEKKQPVSDRLKAIPNAPRTTLDQVERLIRERTGQFFGRDDQLSELDKFVAKNERGVMIVTAPGGFGKSALLANWGARQEGGGALVASHFFNGTMHRTVQATDALKGLLYQIAVLRDAEPPDPSNDLSRLEDQLNAELCKDASADAPLIVVLDGLDEAAQVIEPIMPSGLGKHVYIVASGRAEESKRPPHIASWLYAMNSSDYSAERVLLKPLDIDGVMQWLHERVPNLKENANAIAQRLLATTEGIPLYLRFIVDDIRQRLDAGIQVEDIKRSLLTLPAPFTDYAAQQLEAIQKMQGLRDGWLDVQQIFALLTLIRGAMPASEIAAVLGVLSDVTTMDTSITRWFAIRLGETEASVAFLHPRLAEVFYEALTKSPQTQGLVHKVERRLIEHCAAWKTNRSLYGLINLPWHLAQANDATRALQVLTSIAFLEARVSHDQASSLVAQTLTDFAAVTEAVPASLKSVARSWFSFWATIESKLQTFVRAQRLEEANLLLLQVLADTVGPPNSALSEREKSKVSWRQIAGRRAPSNLLRSLEGHTNSVKGALALADGRLLSWSRDKTLRLWSQDGAPLGELIGHSRSVKGALALADGRLLSWSGDGTLRLWSQNGAPLSELIGHTVSVTGALALASDCLLSWSADSTLRLWSQDGAPLAELKGHTRSVKGALALADGRLLSWSRDRTLRLLRKKGGPLSELKGHTDSVEGVLVLADGRLLSWGDNRTLRLWSQDGAPLGELKGHTDWINGALVLVDGRLLSWSADNTFRLWSPDGAPLAELKGHTRPVDGALALADGRLLSWSRDRTLRLWSQNGVPLGELVGHTHSVTGALELAGGRLLSWSDDRTLRLWSREGAPLAELKGHTRTVRGALGLADGRPLSWGDDRTLRLWSQDSAPLGTLVGHTHAVTGALALADGRLLSLSRDRTLRLWSADGASLRALVGHTHSVKGALAMADGRLLSWSDDRTLRLWSQDGAPFGELKGHKRSVKGALALADGCLLSWGADRTLRLWSADGVPLGEPKGSASPVNGALALAKGRLLTWGNDTLRLWSWQSPAFVALVGHTHSVTGALALADGRLLSWSGDGTVRIWSADGASLGELKGQAGPAKGARALAGGRVLSWSGDKILRLWSPDGAPLGDLTGHTQVLTGALVLADGRLLSWSRDRTLRLWSQDGAPLGELIGHTRSVKGALALADGRLLSWSADGTLRLWSQDATPLQPWLWPYAALEKVIPHVVLADHLWVLAGNDVLLVQHRL